MGTTAALGEEAEGTAPAGGPERPPGPVRAWLPVGVVVAAAAVLSLPRLGARTLWLDEAYTVGATTELLDTWRETAGNQALYYLLVWPISRLSTDPAWLRLPAALLGLAAVVVVYRVGRRLGGPTRAGLAAGGLALSWGLARYSVEARSYTLALLLVATGWLALIAALQSDDDDGDSGDGAAAADRARRRWWRLFYVVTALVPLAHGLSALNYVAQLGALAVAPGDRRRLLRRALVVAPVLVVEFTAMFLLGAGDVGDWVAPLSPGQLLAFVRLLLGVGLTGVVVGALVAAAVIDVVRRYLRERSREAWLQVLPVFWALGPATIVLVLSLARPYAAARYVFPSLAAVHLLVAGLLVAHLRTTRRLAAASLVVAVLLVSDQRSVTTDGIEDWPELTACIAANSAPGDRLVTAAAHRSALDYHWSDHPGLARVEPLSPSEPLGEVRRLYEAGAVEYEEVVSLVLDDADESIWYVDRTPDGRLAILGLVFNTRLATGYRLVEPWYFEGDLTLTRLDPVGRDRPRGEAPCDVVPTPEDMLPAPADD